jgi:hypothetical protein
VCPVRASWVALRDTCSDNHRASNLHHNRHIEKALGGGAGEGGGDARGLRCLYMLCFCLDGGRNGSGCLPFELLVLLLQCPDPPSGVILFFLLLLLVLASTWGGVGACLVWPTGTGLAYPHDRQRDREDISPHSGSCS